MSSSGLTVSSFSLRHERAQLQESQHLPHQRQTGEHSDGAQAQREALPGGSGRQRKGTGWGAGPPDGEIAG